MSAAYRLCAIVPTLDNPITVRRVVEGIRAHALPVILIDDGSGPAGRAACEQLAAEGLVALRRRDVNGGKGAAVLAGFEAAESLGYTHAFQIDADGQHDLQQIPAFSTASRAAGDALVLGYPVYDESVPSARRVGRRFTALWVGLEVGSRAPIRDAMIGFRIYPLGAVRALGSLGRGMEFDIEVAVRLVRAGTPTLNLPVAVHYPTAEDGGVSHFRPLTDNLRFSLLHARLCTAGCFTWLGRALTGRIGGPR